MYSLFSFSLALDKLSAATLSRRRIWAKDLAIDIWRPQKKSKGLGKQKKRKDSLSFSTTTTFYSSSGDTCEVLHGGCRAHREANVRHPSLPSRQKIDNGNAAEFQADPGTKDFWHTDLDLSLLSCQLLLPSALGLAEFALADGLYIVPCPGTCVEAGLLGLGIAD